MCVKNSSLEAARQFHLVVLDHRASHLDGHDKVHSVGAPRQILAECYCKDVLGRRINKNETNSGTIKKMRARTLSNKLS